MSGLSFRELNMRISEPENITILLAASFALLAQINDHFS